MNFYVHRNTLNLRKTKAGLLRRTETGLFFIKTCKLLGYMTQHVLNV